MTLDHAVALSLWDELPRVGLTDRLLSDDPQLLDRATAGLAAASRIRRHAEDLGIGVLAWNDPRFPAGLLATSDCPPALWYRGNLAALEPPAIAIVGSRAASAVAIETATRLGQDLASRGIVVVSGLARGVDSAAHRGALQQGRTVAVLGSGVDRVYPSEHRELAASIATEGLVMSEFAPGSAPLPFRFPLRNRIISGLSRAVVVIEASDKSGSLITAACALEQGREVMAVPGNVLTGRNRGGHALIRDGATMVETADDVLVELGFGARRPGPGASSAGADGPVDSNDPVMRAMEAGQPYDLDGLAAACGLDVARLLPRISELELCGLVRRLDGGRFIRSVRTC